MSFHSLRIICCLIGLLFSVSGSKLSGQNNYGNIAPQQRENIRNFSITWSNWYGQQKIIADSLAQLHHYSSSFLSPDGSVVSLRRMDHSHPVWVHTHNLDAAITADVTNLWDDSEQGLTGQGISTGLWDGGAVLTNHNEFTQTGVSRIIQRDQASSFYNHSTHLAGTIAAGGVNEACHGMAPLATIIAYDFNYDISEMGSEAADGLQASNHSYGTICGWKYNSSDESWYWYGDLSISSDEDLNFGRYTKESYDLDLLSSIAPWYTIVKSAGNDRNDSPPENTPHFDFSDHWYQATDYHPPDGYPEGYECLGSMSVAKNIITVGAVEEMLTPYSDPEDVKMSIFSSWGPTDDGRIKPDLVANGTSVFSSIAENINQYATYNGTSMAAASVSGVICLINEMQNKCQPSVMLTSATIKGLLIHTAREAGDHPGPDYQFGWGLIDASAAVSLLDENHSSGGAFITESELKEEAFFTREIYISEESPELKVTLCWTDPAGKVADYALDNTMPVLVNDLDLKVTRLADNDTFYPWLLNPQMPMEAAVSAPNHRDNVEQVVLQNPTPGTYIVRVSISGDLANSKQGFSLILSGQEYSSGLFPPSLLKGISENEKVFLSWHQPSEGQPEQYDIYRNNNYLSSSNDTIYEDNNVNYGTEYTYYVTAQYKDLTGESLPTNLVKVIPQKSVSLPYFQTFEDGVPDWSLKNDSTGWQRGNSTQLSSYYLDFSQNTGIFLAADSYSAGEGIHVWDTAITPPLDLNLYENIRLSFKYLFVTGIYDAIDDLSISLCTADSCTEISTLQASPTWESLEVDIPQELYKPNSRLAFHYDDNYRWGMGAGIDDIAITGTPVTTDHKSTQQKPNQILKIIPIGNTHIVTIQNLWECIEKKLDIMSLSGRILWTKMLKSSNIPEIRMILPPMKTGLYILRYSCGLQVYSVKFTAL